MIGLGTMPVGNTVALACHPQTPTEAVHRIAVQVLRSASGTLALSFALEGDLASLRIPPPCAPRFAHQLWEHTCCEAFVAAVGDGAYREFNFSPSGEWAGYAFDAYRSFAGPLDEAPPPRLAVRTAARRFELDARIDLSPLDANAALRLGLAAVIEENDGTLSYWALHHPPGQPDFHHHDALALRLEPSGEQC